MKNWIKSGAPWIWLNGGAVAVSMIMVVGLIGLIAVRGLAHFWPADVVEFTMSDEQGQEQIILGEVRRSEIIPAAVARDSGVVLPEGFDEGGTIERFLFKRGNRDIFNRDFAWYPDQGMSEWRYPEDALVLERRQWGDFIGYPVALEIEGEVVAEGATLIPHLQERVAESREAHDRIRSIERHDIGAINRALEGLRLEQRSLAANEELPTEQVAEELTRINIEEAQLQAQFRELRDEIDALRAETRRDQLKMRAADGQQVSIPLGDIVRATQPNAMNTAQKLGEYGSRFWDFVSGEPREANTEGGIFPAIFGTVTLVMVMSVIVTPFGILAAIYLREYARQGPLLRLIRISVYNLAGVPSIVFGVFGLGFFVYTMGGSIDQLFFSERLPAPTFGRPALIWGALTLALLTLPVVIVSTEEGLARIPSTVREGSLALGATKSETLWKVVVPLATPAMMTGLILAIARAAGEVAPLMLVGVVMLAPSLPIDGSFPYLHLDRSFMHLGFHIYDVGFQSPNVEAARPLVYATALILVLLIITLNLTAISVRNRLRERFRAESD